MEFDATNKQPPFVFFSLNKTIKMSKEDIQMDPYISVSVTSNKCQIGRHLINANGIGYFNISSTFITWVPHLTPHTHTNLGIFGMQNRNPGSLSPSCQGGQEHNCKSISPPWGFKIDYLSPTEKGELEIAPTSRGILFP